ncbi:MAG: hypothetical protein ABSH51_20090 [Solirubrobacteraceae bacterium]|jgi:hypothetical protein
MTFTIRRAPLAAVLAAVAVPASAVASARVLRPITKITAHKVSLTGHVEALSSTGTIGTPGVKDTDAGILDGTISGTPRWEGAITQVATWSTGLAITTTGTAFNTDGALRFTLSGKFTARSPGELALRGRMAVTGGTGIYAGAHGTLAVSGTAVASPATTKLAFRLTGTLSF